MMDRKRFAPRWYREMFQWSGPVGRVQTDGVERRARREGPFTLPEPVLRLAQSEYDIQHPGQPYEQMQERGGLGLLEVVALLADRVERQSAVIATLRAPR